MDKINFKTFVVIGVIVVVVLILIYSMNNSQDSEMLSIVSENTETEMNESFSTSTNMIYQNQEYGFSLSLPISWQNYTATNTKIDSGNLITIRNPNWTIDNPIADIPILVYPISKWTTWEGNNFEGYVTAAPIGPTERGRNQNYVFATAPRYNFAYLTGFQEVEDIIANLKSF